jgi:hypothetical protein
MALVVMENASVVMVCREGARRGAIAEMALVLSQSLSFHLFPSLVSFHV